MSTNQDNANKSIVNTFSAVGSRFEAVEKHIDRTEEQMQGTFGGGLVLVTSLVASSSHSWDVDSSDTEDDTIIPAAKFL